jgi:F-type H+-transporting ATPase subunit epsilon
MPMIQLKIVTPEKVIYSGAVRRVRAPGSEGEFGVLPRHAPMLVSLAIGPLSFAEEDGKVRRMALGGGFAEVGPDQVTVLAETAEPAEAIDLARARAARDRARERLASKTREIDMGRARLALMRALNRLKVAGGN